MLPYPQIDPVALAIGPLKIHWYGLMYLIGIGGAWLLASRQRSVVYAWPALVLVVLSISSLAESSILVEFGWLTFVICCLKASQELSWRRAFSAQPAAEVSPS